MKKQKLLQKILLLALVILVATSLVVPFSAIGKKTAQAATIDELKAQANALQAQIDANNKEAERLSGEADSLKNRIAEFDIQISQINSQIELINIKIAQLDQELIKAQAELDRQKSLLKASIQALYKKGGASTVELLVGSDSFSQFINSQTYLERLKSGIQTSTEKVIKLKQQIQAQQTEQKELLEQQKIQKGVLDNTRNQQASLLSITQGEQSRYEQMIADLQVKRQKIDDEITALVRAGGMVSLGRVHQGNMIGYMGTTGFSTGHHLHFEVRDSSFNVLNPLPLSNYGFIWPAEAPYEQINQEYGCVPWAVYASRDCPQGWSFHAGVDIGSQIWWDTPILAAGDGDIIINDDQGDGYGHKVVIRHDNGYFTVYGHLSW